MIWWKVKTTGNKQTNSDYNSKKYVGLCTNTGRICRNKNCCKDDARIVGDFFPNIFFNTVFFYLDIYWNNCLAHTSLSEYCVSTQKDDSPLVLFGPGGLIPQPGYLIQARPIGFYWLSRANPPGAMCFVWFYLDKIYIIKFTIFSHLKVCSSVVFSTFTMLCNFQH